MKNDRIALVKLMERYREVTVCANIMYVNNIPFLVSLSRNLEFGTVEALPNRQTKSIIAAVKSVDHMYKSGGFRIPSRSHGQRV